MTIRAELDCIYNVRARKGERRGPGGRLVKAIIFRWQADFDDAMAECRAVIAQSNRDCPGYCTYPEARFYNTEDFDRDPLKAAPFKIVSPF